MSPKWASTFSNGLSDPGNGKGYTIYGGGRFYPKTFYVSWKLNQSVFDFSIFKIIK